MALRSGLPAWALLSASMIDGRVLVRTGPSTLYAFAFPQLGTFFFSWRKSSDNGATWSDPVALFTSDTNLGSGCIWFDKWTPGGTGTRVHAWQASNLADDVYYNYLDTANDSQGTNVLVVALASGISPIMSGCKSRGGNLYVAFDIDGGTETGFYRSTDAGVTWGSRSNLINEITPAGDLYQLVPGNYADNQDIDAVFWDASADEISLKFYDDSLNLWTETSIATGFVERAAASGGPQFSTAIRHSDGHLILVAWNGWDVATADLQCWDINGSGSIVAKTNLITNSDDCVCAHLFIDQSTDTLYVFYIGAEGGAQVVGATAGIYFKSSTDGGTTWSAEQTLIDVLGAQVWLGGCPSYSAPMFNVMFAMSSPLMTYVSFFPNYALGRGIGRGM